MTNSTRDQGRAVRRGARNPWRDKRVLLGIAIVLSTAVLGGLLSMLTTSKDSYWVVARDVKAGNRVSPNQLRKVELAAPSEVRRALVSLDELPDSGVWAHDVTQGSLVTRSAIRSELVQGQKLPLKVAIGSLPSELKAGDIVSVWVGPGPNSGPSNAKRILTNVTVADVSDDLGVGDRTVLVDVGKTGPTPEVVAAAGAYPITIVFVQ